MDSRFYAISSQDLTRLANVAKRLFSETRLDGDGMRDLAQTIELIVRVALQLEILDDPCERAQSGLPHERKQP